MNRIFLAQQGETIGQHIKRLRLEKAAEYLCFSNASISDIADELDFNDIASFSKAFKNRFGSSPKEFRSRNEKKQISIEKYAYNSTAPLPLEFETEVLPGFDYIYLEYQGNYEDEKAINKLWEKFFWKCYWKRLVKENSIFFGEILDDNDISDHLYCRYRACLILEKPLEKESKLSIGHHARQEYVKFKHIGRNEMTDETYYQIYLHWENTVQKEFADLPTLEFYHELESNENSLTEIYIPIV